MLVIIEKDCVVLTYCTDLVIPQCCTYTFIIQKSDVALTGYYLFFPYMTIYILV